MNILDNDESDGPTHSGTFVPVNMKQRSDFYFDKYGLICLYNLVASTVGKRGGLFKIEA
jgi:hypothetical protein